MIYLFLTIILSALLFTGFKWFDQKKIVLLPAICGNYFTCIITGLLMNKGFSFEGFDSLLITGSISLGVLFFLVFYAMGYASAKIGVGISSASSKMSLAIPVLYGIVFLKEDFNFLKICALIMTLIAVYMMTFQKGNSKIKGAFLIPLLIFLGSGVIDTSINIIQIKMKELNIDDENSIILFFSGAFITSIICIFIKERKLIKDIRSLSYGGLLGVPNFFSIYFMIKTLESSIFPSNQFYMLNNTGTMVLCFIVGLLVFREKITFLKGTGLLMAILSIYLILYK